jgi:hypothetical protein
MLQVPDPRLSQKQLRSLAPDFRREHSKPSHNDRPPVRNELLVPVSLDDIGCTLGIPGRQGMFYRFRDQALGFEPLAGPGMECGDLFGAASPLQLALEKVLKQVMVPKPSVFRVQGNHKQVTLLGQGYETLSVNLALAWLQIRRTQHIAQRDAKPIQDGCTQKITTNGRYLRIQDL